MVAGELDPYITEKSVITQKVNNEIEEISFSALEKNNCLVVVGIKEGKNETITAKIIRLFPKTTPTLSPEKE